MVAERLIHSCMVHHSAFLHASALFNFSSLLLCEAVHTCNPVTREVETSKFLATLYYKARPCLKKSNPNQSLRGD
jgi:hypothetical protein